MTKHSERGHQGFGLGPGVTGHWRPPACGGFTFLELVIAVAIIFVLSAVAVPQLLHAIWTSNVRAAATDLSGLIQQARILAERQNTTLPVYAGTVETNLQGAFVGTLGSTWQATEPDIPYAGGVLNGSASNAPSALSPGFTAEPDGTTLYFGPRGLPMKSSGATYVLSNGVIFYITDTHGNWGAVSVTAAGRSKVWMWNGAAWQ